MKLESHLAPAEAVSGVTRIGQAQHCCSLARQLERAGEFEAAREALSSFWPNLGGQPVVEGLDRQTTAEILLRVGTLMGWLGGANQSQRQESAKDLITRSIEIFTELREPEQVAEAQSDLALCYWREGGFDEARVNLAAALEHVRDENDDLKALVLIRAAEVERSAGCLNDALRFLENSASLVNQSHESSLKGGFHSTLANVLNQMGLAQGREDYRDNALIEYAAASVHFEHAGHMRHWGRVENNLGVLYQSITRFPEAYEHISRARDIFQSLGDEAHVAQVDDTRARAFLGEGRYVEAERYARAAVRTLGKGDECSLLVEALTTHGITLARLGRHSTARSELNRAIEVGENCGDLEGAGRAKLSIIEELSGQTSASEMASIYESAMEILKKSQDPSATQRLIASSAVVIDTFLAAETQSAVFKAENWEGFSFKRELRGFEKALVERALRDAGGSVTKASRLLGFRHHQSLISLINSRHKDLLKTRSKVHRRRRHLFSGRAQALKGKHKSQINVLHVEDNEPVKKLVEEILTAEDMHVDSCTTGTTAFELLKRRTKYDVVILDNDLPGLTGLELLSRVRNLAHRQRTPIIMLSGDEVEKEAWRAGVDDFVRKPDAVSELIPRIRRVLKKRKSEK